MKRYILAIKSKLGFIRCLFVPVKRAILKHYFPAIVSRIETSITSKDLIRYFFQEMARISIRDIKATFRKSQNLGVAIDVLYISEKASPDSIKDIIALKKEGNLTCTLLCRTHQGNDKLCEKYHIPLLYYKNYLELILLLLSARAKVVIARRGDIHSVALARMFYSGKVIYKAYDFISRYPFEYQDDVRLAAEKYVIEHVDGIIHFHEEEAIDYLKSLYKITCPIVQLRPMCMDEFIPGKKPTKLSEKDGEIHIVYAAGLFRSYSNPFLTGDSNHYDEFKEITSQGIHIHVYIAYRRDSDEDYGLKPYFDLAKACPYFHIEQTLPYSELIDVLTQYDFAYAYFDMEQTVRLKPFNSGVSNNFFTYLDVGLPIISSESTYTQARLIREFSIGLVINREEIQGIKKLLHEFDIDLYTKNRLIARQNLMHEGKKLASAMAVMT